jgi:hypothetical protein
MDSDDRTRVDARLVDSWEQFRTLVKLIPTRQPERVRFDLARSSVDLAIEHHSSIIKLIGTSKNSASAAALLRPLLEAGANAWWLMYCAASERVRGLKLAVDGNSTADTPQLEDALKALRLVFPDAGVILDGLKNKGPATWLHKFTHGGILQLHRRSDVDHWSADELIMHLIAADTFALIASAVCARIYDAPQIEEYVRNRRDELGDQLDIITHQVSKARPALELPEVTLVDEWDMCE